MTVYAPKRRARERMMSHPPAGWGLLFAAVPGSRSRKARCLICGASGYGDYGRNAGRVFTDFAGRPIPAMRPAPWQARCLVGHPARCGTCRRVFVSNTALAGHRTCKLHHECCTRHTTVPAWKKAFGGAA